ncbi:MAG: zinc metallopeptidase [Treponema sp.]|nr:zinc metallopeptidase [Treponema sp.]
MDITYLIFVLPFVALSMIASFMVNSRFKEYNKVISKRGISGAQAAQLLLRENEITDVEITHINGQLTDNYNSLNKTLNLSDATYASKSIAAIGVAAHETGHAIQHKVGYGPLGLRSTLVPVANIGSRFGPMLAIAGIILGANAGNTTSIWPLITNIGLLLFCGAVLFYLVTLPVEFDASARALKILQETNTLDEEELAGVKKVLWAAAMTYVASALTAIGNLLRLVVLSRSSRRR